MIEEPEYILESPAGIILGHAIQSNHVSEPQAAVVGHELIVQEHRLKGTSLHAEVEKVLEEEIVSIRRLPLGSGKETIAPLVVKFAVHLKLRSFSVPVSMHRTVLDPSSGLDLVGLLKFAVVAVQDRRWVS